MAKVIAVAGKGGTGKTTVAALTIRRISKTGPTPIMAVDADPNSNLGETLGIEVTRTIGDMREDFMKAPDQVPPGMDKNNYLQMLMSQILIEEEHFDLLVMGRQEGPGCYCFVNNVLRKFSDELAQSYKVILTDNEAGMEHLSRRTANKIHELFLVTDHALRGLRAVRRINELIDELNLRVENRGIIVNRAPETLAPEFLEEVKKIGLPIVATIPDDANLAEYDMSSKSLMELPEDSPSVLAVDKLVDSIFAT